VKLEKALQYATHHSESIIQWLVLAILVLTGLLIAKSLFGKKSEVASGAGAGAASPDNGELQAFMQKMIERTSKLEAMPLTGMSEAIASSVDSQVQALKLDLAAREEEIGKLKAAGNPAPSQEADGLSARIKELESKLAEYEILEDDIADLSLFKEENARLKSEVERLKGDRPVEGEPIPTVVTEAEPVVAPPSLGEELKIAETGDPMQDFESALKLEKKLAGVETPQETAPPLVEPAEPEGDDLFAEFAKALPETPVEDLDTEKMMSEMEALNSATPSADASGLHDESIDTDKMAAEASNLNKA